MNHAHTFPSSHRDRMALERRRLKAAKLFVKGHTQAEVARRLKVTREAARKWHKMWARSGLEALKSTGKPGPKPLLTAKKLKKVEQALLKGPTAFGFATQIWTLARIAKVIQRVAKVAYHPGHIWYVLKNLNWTCQKPAIKAGERDETAIQRWRKTSWPCLKKKRLNLAQN